MAPVPKHPIFFRPTLFLICFMLFAFSIGHSFGQEASPVTTPPPAADSSAQTQSEDSSLNGLKKLSLEQLMDLDVTSVSKQSEPYGEAPAAIEVITNDEIRRSGATNFPEALRLADNLDVAQKGSHGWSISARGFNTDFGNKLLVLMDGRSVYTPLFSGVFWDTQDYLLEDIDRIEVVSGPGGTLWGANAVNGVINITSKSAKDTQGLYLEGGGGSQPLDFIGARYGGQLGSGLYYRVYGKYFDRDNLVNPDGGAVSDSWRMGQGGFRLDGQFSPEETFTLHGDYYGGDEEQTEEGNAEISGDNIVGRWSHVYPTGSDLSLQLYYDRTYLYLPKAASPATGAGAGTLVDSLETYDLDFQHHFHWDQNHNFVWGLGSRVTLDRVQNAPTVAFEPANLDQGLFSAFAQDELTLGKDLFFTLGSKVEHNDYTGFEFEPSARLKWNRSEDQMLWLAVSRAVRTPSRVDRDERIPTPSLAGPPFYTDDLLIGGADFKSETLIAYELGYRAQLDKNISTSLSTFFNNYDDIRSTGITPTGVLHLPLVYQNNLLAQTWGMELSLDYQVLEGWRLHGGYDLLKENLWLKPGQTDFSNKLNETADPENRITLRSAMDLPGNLELDAAWRWLDSFVYNNNGAPATVPGYAELDIRLGWHFSKSVEISVTGQNLLNDHHLEYVASGSDQPEEVQRGVYGKLACQF